MKKTTPRTIQGQFSFELASDKIQAAVTRLGGHMGPVTFRLGDRTISPFSVAPWTGERIPAGTPNLLRVLRGDFFCLPFGGNATPFQGEQHPPHGETANNRWRLLEQTQTPEKSLLRLGMKTRVRPGRVEKTITLLPGHTVIYQEHQITGMQGPMSFGHHATLRFPDRIGAGRLSTSRLIHGQVFLEPTEQPAQRGYSLLKPGAVFEDLAAVPTITGELADLSHYPARRGFEDIAILVADPTLDFAWSAVAFPEEGYVWFSLRDPKVLTSTLLWMSNGGRHYAPWNGRHINVMGVEDITAFFHAGLAESATPNPLTASGFTTHRILDASQPFVVRYVMGLAEIPSTFDRVRDIHIPEEGHITLLSDSGCHVTTQINNAFLSAGTHH